MTKPDLSLILYLHTLHLNYSHIVLLEYYKEGTSHFLPTKHKLKNDLVTYGFVHGDQLLPKGEQLLKTIEEWTEVYQNNMVKEQKKPGYSEEFQEFWNTFPSSPNFEYKGKTFSGTRNLRTSKSQCEAKYNLILKTGKVTHQEILSALKLEIEMRMEESIKSGTNKLDFFKGCPSWLSNRSWEVFLPLVGKKKKESFNSEIVI